MWRLETDECAGPFFRWGNKTIGVITSLFPEKQKRRRERGAGGGRGERETELMLLKFLSLLHYWLALNLFLYMSYYFLNMSYYLLRICPLNISGLWLTSWVDDRDGKWKHGFYNIWEDGGGSKRGFLPINKIKGDANSYEARKMYMFSIWCQVLYEQASENTIENRNLRI